MTAVRWIAAAVGGTLVVLTIVAAVHGHLAATAGKESLAAYRSAQRSLDAVERSRAAQEFGSVVGDDAQQACRGRVRRELGPDVRFLPPTAGQRSILDAADVIPGVVVVHGERREFSCRVERLEAGVRVFEVDLGDVR